MLHLQLDEIYNLKGLIPVVRLMQDNCHFLLFEPPLRFLVLAKIAENAVMTAKHIHESRSC